MWCVVATSLIFCFQILTSVQRVLTSVPRIAITTSALTLAAVTLDTGLILTGGSVMVRDCAADRAPHPHTHTLHPPPPPHTHTSPTTSTPHTLHSHTPLPPTQILTSVPRVRINASTTAITTSARTPAAVGLVTDSTLMAGLAMVSV